MPPDDPRFLAATDEIIALEYETFLAASGEILKTCPKCGGKTHRKHCTTCLINGQPVPLTGDVTGDEIAARMAAGEKVDLDEIFRKENFKPVEITGD